MDANIICAWNMCILWCFACHKVSVMQGKSLTQYLAPYPFQTDHFIIPRFLIAMALNFLWLFAMTNGVQTWTEYLEYFHSNKIFLFKESFNPMPHGTGIYWCVSQPECGWPAVSTKNTAATSFFDYFGCRHHVLICSQTTERTEYKCLLAYTFVLGRHPNKNNEIYMLKYTAFTWSWKLLGVVSI